jgi:hypothetical protein
VEAVARDVAASHYARRFGKPIDDAHVRQNVERNWRAIGLPSVREVLASLEAHGHGVPEGWEEAAQIAATGRRP